MKKWVQVKGEKFSIKASDMFALRAKDLPIEVMVNAETGEIKIFSRPFFEEKGSLFYEDLLNKKDI